ncbi:hypothetical protein HanIR_Chr07g0337141 [Helianthus annuus]|nr:hypothetical protein HanIR_Chr07g0337141 [Helianthus annuus]
MSEQIANRRTAVCVQQCCTISNRAGDKKYTRTPTCHQSSCADHCFILSNKLLMIDQTTLTIFILTQYDNMYNFFYKKFGGSHKLLGEILMGSDSILIKFSDRILENLH